MKNAVALSIVAAALALPLGTMVLAQPGGAEGADRRTQAQVDRLMNNDQNGDGKLSADELPGNMAARLFPTADSDGDGLLTRDELGAFFSGGRPAAPAGGAGVAAGSAEAFAGTMKQAGGAMRALRRSRFEPGTRDSDVAAAQSMQEAMIGAKDSAAAVAMSDAARARFGEDEDAYRVALRLALIESARAALDLEEAVLREDAEGARSALARLMAGEKTAHELFQGP